MTIVHQSQHRTKQSPTNINASERGTEQRCLHIKDLISLIRQSNDGFTEPYWLLAKWMACSETTFANFTTVMNVLLKLLDNEEINNMYVKVLFLAAP